MIILSVQNLARSFGENQVLKDVSFVLQGGHCMGLVGANGCGKSTLLKLIAGLDTPDSGTISVAKGLSIGYLAQQGMVTAGLTVRGELELVLAPLRTMEARLLELEQELEKQRDDEKAVMRLSAQYSSQMEAYEAAGGYSQESTVSGMLVGLGFGRERWNQPVETLSGGEKTRLCLGKLLLQKPDILLLDEPTNHLDLASLQWLESYLKECKSSVILVSHDRYFLDSVCTDICELIFGGVEQYEGNYTRYLDLRAERFETRQRAYEHQQQEIARQEAIIERLKSYNREKSLKRARSREKVLDKMELLEKPKDEQQIRFSFTTRRRTGDDVLMLSKVGKGFDGHTLFSNLDLHLRAGDRVALIGPNGVGKTTLLRLLTKEETADEGTIRYGANVDIGYYDQHQADLHEDKTVLDELWDSFPQMEQSTLRSVLGCFLFSGDDVFQPIRTLSGGERGRVSLTRLMLRKDNFLLLDEPTNHLDMDSREVLEEALEDYPGTILTVSHDRYFINRIANRVVEMRPDGVSFYLGNYDDYLEKKRMNALGIDTDQPQKTKTAIDKEKKRDRQSREALKQAREDVKRAEQEIAHLEEEKETLEAAMGTPEVYQNPQKAKDTANAVRKVQDALEEAYARWEESSLALEELE